MLLSRDLSCVTAPLLLQAELRDGLPVFPIQSLPNLSASSLPGRRISIAWRIGRFDAARGAAQQADQYDDSNGSASRRKTRGSRE